MPPIKQILTKVSSLNGAQRRLGHYLQNDSTALLYANVNELARAVGVSNATVVRFAKSLGYKGFPEFKRDIQREMRRKLRAADRMEETFAQLRGEENILAKLINRDIQLLQETVRAVSYPDFHKAVELILRARKVFLIGLNASMDSLKLSVTYIRPQRSRATAHTRHPRSRSHLAAGSDSCNSRWTVTFSVPSMTCAGASMSLSKAACSILS